MRTGRVREAGARSATWLLGAIAAVVVAASALAPAQAAPTIPVRLTVTNATVDASFVYVSGELLTMAGQALPSITLAVDLNSAPQGQTTTQADGSYSYAFPRPASGNYTIRVRWDGDSDHIPASGTMRLNVPEVAPKCTTGLSLSLDPSDTFPGDVVAIIGHLACADAAIPQAVVQLSTTYGNVDAVVATDEQGGFSAYMAIPEGTGFPSSYTVTAAFGGDEVYVDSTATASGTITALTQVDPTADPGGASATSTSAVQPTAPAASATPTPPPTSNPLTADDSSMIAVIVAFCAVALIGAGALVILAVISHNRKRLDQDERRGFGTDFGKEH